MKKTLLTLITLLPLITFAQNFKDDPNYVKQAVNDKGYMLDTVGVSTLTKSQLFSNALSFLTNNFKDSRSVIESKDLELGEISFKGNTFKNIQVSDTSKKGKIANRWETVRLHFKCKIYLKDQKFKIVLNSLQKPFSEMIASDTLLPIDPYANGIFSNSDKAASELALDLIKNIAKYLNTKPENEF